MINKAQPFTTPVGGHICCLHCRLIRTENSSLCRNRSVSKIPLDPNLWNTSLGPVFLEICCQIFLEYHLNLENIEQEGSFKSGYIPAPPAHSRQKPSREESSWNILHRGLRLHDYRALISSQENRGLTETTYCRLLASYAFKKSQCLPPREAVKVTEGQKLASAYTLFRNPASLFWYVSIYKWKEAYPFETHKRQTL